MTSAPLTASSSPSSPRSSRLVLLLGIGLLIATLAGAGGWFVFVRSDSPPPASLSTATQGLTVGSSTRDTSATPTSVSSASSASASASAPSSSSSSSSAASSSSPTAAVWDVDASVTSNSGGSFAGFRLEEVLSNVGSTTVVGRSSGVTGSLTFDNATLVSGSFTVDLTALATDKTQRDSRMKSALETTKFPTATFTVDGPIALGAEPTEGAVLSIDVPGTFTIHGKSVHSTVHIDATVTNGVLAVVGSAPFVLADYSLTVPSAPIVVSVEDHGIIEFQLYLTPA